MTSHNLCVRTGKLHDEGYPPQFRDAISEIRAVRCLGISAQFSTTFCQWIIAYLSNKSQNMNSTLNFSAVELETGTTRSTNNFFFCFKNRTPAAILLPDLLPSSGTCIYCDIA